MSYEKILIVTRRTRLEELVAKFNTRSQAKFYIEHSGGDFNEYQDEHDAYCRSLDYIRRELTSTGLACQLLDRQYLPTFLFAPGDLVVVLGQDGLVANTAKYAGVQPVVGVNPDPERVDGILVPVSVTATRRVVEAAIAGKAGMRSVTLAEAELNDGQRLLAFNDLFIGARSHVSARYRLEYGGSRESQSSSGIIVSTGAGSTGWLSSIFNMVSSVNRFAGGKGGESFAMDWESSELMFVVREPFRSRHSSADIVAGMLYEGATLVVESCMPSGGTIFSDGIESDFVNFNSGMTATIGIAPRCARLVVSEHSLPASRDPGARQLAKLSPVA